MLLDPLAHKGRQRTSQNAEPRCDEFFVGRHPGSLLRGLTGAGRRGDRGHLRLQVWQREARREAQIVECHLYLPPPVFFIAKLPPPLLTFV